MVFPRQLSGSLILVGWPGREGHSPIIPVIQTHLPHRFCLTVDFLGLSRNGSSSQVINQSQDFSEQIAGHGDFCQLERDIATMAHDLGTDLD